MVRAVHAPSCIRDKNNHRLLHRLRISISLYITTNSTTAIDLDSWSFPNLPSRGGTALIFIRLSLVDELASIPDSSHYPNSTSQRPSSSPAALLIERHPVVICGVKHKSLVPSYSVTARPHLCNLFQRVQDLGNGVRGLELIQLHTTDTTR